MQTHSEPVPIAEHLHAVRAILLNIMIEYYVLESKATSTCVKLVCVGKMSAYERANEVRGVYVCMFVG